MKTAISLDDQTFYAAEAFAQQAGMSRSELYATALREYLRAKEQQAMTEAYNRVHDALDGESEAETAQVIAAGKRTLGRQEW